MWRERGQFCAQCMSAEYDCLGSGSVMVSGVSLLGCTHLVVIGNGALNAIRCRGDNFHSVVRLFTSAVGLGFVLMDDNTTTITMLEMSLITWERSQSE